MLEQYTGPEKAAIFLMSLGEEKAAAVLSNMEEREIQILGNYMSSLGEVSVATLNAVTQEFYKSVEAGTGGLGIGGMDFLKSRNNFV